MRVILELVSGPQAGRRIQLLRNQRVQVGNTSWADFVVRDDADMAGQHFALETDYQSCRLRDLAGTGTTQLNGEPVTDAVLLKSGDQISAGQSRFVVQIEGGAAPPVEANVPTKAPVAAPATRPAPPPAPATSAVQQPERIIFKEQCDSGAWHYFGTVESCPPGELAHQLGALWPLYLMADFRRAKVAPPPGSENAPMLFDWLGPHGRPFSPILLSPEIAPEAAGIVQEGWGQDGIVGVFSTHSSQEIVDHLRSNVRLGKDRVVGICWPGILNQICAHYRPDFVRNVLSIASAVMVESPDGVEWNLYSLSPIDEPLQAFGFKLTRPEEAAAA